MERAQRQALQDHLERLADGDRAAFRPLFDLAWPEVRAVARRMLPGSDDAEDAAQTALIKLFERASEFDATRDALAWIVSIVTYECLTLRRRASRRRETGAEALATAADGTTHAEDRMMKCELEQLAVATLGQLGPLDRDALETAFLVEAREGPRSPTLRKRIERALTRLRAAWRDHGIR